MVQTRNYTVAADSTKTLRPDKLEAGETDKSESAAEPSELSERDEHGEPSEHSESAEPETSKPQRQPRRLEPRIDNVLTLDEATRNKMKYRYRFIIGEFMLFSFLRLISLSVSPCVHLSNQSSRDRQMS